MGLVSPDSTYPSEAVGGSRSAACNRGVAVVVVGGSAGTWTGEEDSVAPSLRVASWDLVAVVILFEVVTSLVSFLCMGLVLVWVQVHVHVVHFSPSFVLSNFQRILSVCFS